MSTHRFERVASLIQHELAETLATRVKDPRVGFVTITEVVVSPDLSHATIWVSIMGDDEDKEGAMDGLESARGFMRSRLARALDLRVAPELRFRLDRGVEHGTRIDELLDQIKRGKSAS